MVNTIYETMSEGSASPSATNFRDWLIDYLKTTVDCSIVDLLSAQCGLGKSTCVTIEISEALRDYEYGLLVITDEIERMEAYTRPNGKDSNLGAYLERNKNRILILTHENISEVRAKLYSYQVVIMSTQRFFALSRKEVLDLVGTFIPKRRIIIDERAPLSEIVTIDIEVFAKIYSILNKGLTNVVHQGQKLWLVDQWERVMERYRQVFQDFEYKNETEQGEVAEWYYNPDGRLTEDDERFTDLVFKRYAGQLRYFDPDIHKKLRAIMQIADPKQGALLFSNKVNGKARGRYANFFKVALSHDDLVLNTGAKVVILDGSGHIDPIYNTWYVQKVDCTKFNRRLDNLRINIVDMTTSQRAIADGRKDSNEKLKTVIDYVKVLPGTQAVFTYQKIERAFKDIVDTTAHFNDLKGRNDLRQLTDVVQVGVNRFPSEDYYAMAVNEARQKHPPESKATWSTNYTTAARRIMLQSVLCDLVQNVFRTAIRNPDDPRRVTYTVLFRATPLYKNGVDVNELSSLIDMIREEFEPLGAQVNLISTPAVAQRAKILQRKTGDGKSNAQRIQDWIDALDAGTAFGRKDILQGTGLSVQQYKNALKYNRTLRAELDSMKIEEGKYVKPLSSHGFNLDSRTYAAL